MATSDTTYHSFHDIELFAPDSPPKAQAQEADAETPDMSHKENRSRPEPTTPMKRQDSGYESIPPRHSISSSTGGSKRRISNASSNSSRTHAQTQTPAQSPSRTQSRPCSSRGRPTIRRSPKTSPYPVRSAAGKVQALYASRSQAVNKSPLCPSRQSPPGHAHSGFFHFPIHPTDLEAFPKPPAQSSSPAVPAPIPAQPLELEPESPSESLPPQSTHYWTSDRTRRLEYAAIDAAHRGLKGWVRRHLVPGCFLPKEKGHVAFDDDTGSVRRYRLELDEECIAEKAKKPSAWGRIKSW